MTMDDALRCLLIEHARRFDERLEAEMRRLEQLRASDGLAVSVAHEGVRERMEGFPQRYATKQEQDAIKETAQRLEANSINREIYDQSMATMRESLNQKLDKQVFDSTLGEWVTWRRQVEQRLNAASGIQHGVSRTFAWALATAGAVTSVVLIILTYN